MSNFPRRLPRLFALFNLLLALLQLSLLPAVGSGRELDVLGQVHADALGVAFGVAWTLALASAAWLASGDAIAGWARLTWEPAVIAIGLLVTAYSGNQAILVLGLGTAGTGTWRALVTMGSTQSKSVLRAVLVGVALLIAATALSGTVRDYTPPAGGTAQSWTWYVATAVVLSVAASAGCLQLFARPGGDSAAGGRASTVRGIYVMAAPYVLAKMLVGAAWEPAAAWVVVLGGLLILLAGAYLTFAGRDQRRPVATTLAGAAVVGLGLGSSAAMAAGGAIWLMLAGLLCLLPVPGALWRAVTLAAVVPGVWLVTQGALYTGYGVAAVLILPACLFAVLWSADDGTRIQRVPLPARIAAFIATATAIAAAIYPQAGVEWIVRPVITALAGGVGALPASQVDWGVGIAFRSAQETLQAGLPVTGIAVGLLITAAFLYWLKQLAAHFIRRADEGGQEE